jgi:flagellar hook-associated protein 1 FlgK
MSISSALNSAMSGLNAAARASHLVSSNISNASTPGYARRTLSVASSGDGFTNGVRVNGVVRHVDSQILSDRRLAGAEFGYRNATTGFLNTIENLLGTPDQPGSLSARLSGFESSLITAGSRPDANERLDAAAWSARDLANAINAVSDGVQDARTQADRTIGSQVEQLNQALKAVEEVNVQIVAATSRRADTAALEDQRQTLIDDISEMVPVRTVPRANNAVALFSTGGAILLDGGAAEIGFEPTSLVTPYMSVEDGTLSGLTLNGFAINTSSQSGSLRGGTLGAQFEIRDELAPEAQQQIDAIARDLIERFQSTSVDPSLAPGQAGLFTDGGAALDITAEVGLASRLSLNSLVDPATGGETWRMRDGLGAATPGATGNAQLLNALSDALTTNRTPGSGDFGGATFSALTLTTAFTSQIGADRLRQDQQLGFASAQFNEFIQLELAGGVDTDAELQRLMIVEQAYAANARVIKTVDEMLDSILRI